MNLYQPLFDCHFELTNQIFVKKLNLYHTKVLLMLY